MFSKIWTRFHFFISTQTIRIYSSNFCSILASGPKPSHVTQALQKQTLAAKNKWREKMVVKMKTSFFPERDTLKIRPHVSFDDR
jgi:hypothetical protein